VALALDGLPERVPRVVRLELGEQAGASSILSVGGSEASSTTRCALARQLYLVVELGRDQRGQRHQRQRDPGVAQRQQRRRLAAGALGQQLAGDRRKRQADAEAGQQLRPDRPERRRCGMNARPPMPPATSRQPATARASAAPRTVEPARAASGSTVTVAAAASGSTLQPLISSRTSRNTTAVIAPDSSPSAAPATRSRGGRGSASWTVAIGLASSAGAAASAIGAWAMKIARQSNSSVRTPPSAGPAAVPATAAPSHSRRPAPPPSRASKAAAAAPRRPAPAARA